MTAKKKLYKLLCIQGANKKLLAKLLSKFAVEHQYAISKIPSEALAQIFQKYKSKLLKKIPSLNYSANKPKSNE